MGRLLILAGAGSGKTRVIAHRVAWLIQEGHALPDQVLAVTFTNKAAEEMRARVGALLEADCRAMWISTFHALCARLLRREAHHLGLSRSFTIYDSADQQSVIKQLVREYGLDDSTYQPRMVLGRISHAKNRMEGPESFADTWNPRDREIGRLFEGYRKALADASALDFDDLLIKTRRALRHARRLVRERYARRFRFAMIDEYQDTNRPQYLLVKQLVSVHAQSLRRRGSRSVDLQVAWRRCEEHPGFRGRLPRGAHGEARAELPLNAGHPRCGVRGRPKQP